MADKTPPEYKHFVYEPNADNQSNVFNVIGYVSLDSAINCAKGFAERRSGKPVYILSISDSFTAEVEVTKKIVWTRADGAKDIETRTPVPATKETT